MTSSPLPPSPRREWGKDLIKNKSLPLGEDLGEAKKKLTRFRSALIIFMPYYFTFSTTALKASGWFIARSARVFLLSVIPFFQASR